MLFWCFGVLLVCWFAEVLLRCGGARMCNCGVVLLCNYVVVVLLGCCLGCRVVVLCCCVVVVLVRAAAVLSCGFAALLRFVG